MRLLRELDDDGAVIASRDVLSDVAGLHRLRELLAGEDEVNSPADVLLPQVSPRRPPGEDAINARMGAHEIDEAMIDRATKERTLIRSLTDRA